MTKKNIMPVIVLTVICVVVAALLGVVNMLTAPIIAEAEAQKVYDSFRNVLDGVYEDANVPETAPSSVTAMYKVSDKDGKLLGHVATVTVKGYAGNISVTVGVDADGKVTKAEVTASAETHGKAGMATYTDNFQGLDAAGVEAVDTFTGATISSTAIRGAILDAVNAITGVEVDDSAKEETLPKTDDEIVALAKELIGKEVELTNVTPEKTTLVKRMYKASANNGYVAYVVAISPNYGTVETETLIHISNAGKIVKVNKLLWKTSDAMYGYVPPTEDVVNEFYGKLPGNSSGTVGDVDLVTNATSTSTRLMDGIKEALAVADTLIKNDMPTSEDNVKALAKELIGKDVELVDVTPDDTTLVRKMYKAGTNGYVAYVVVISANYGTVETETLIHISNTGKIVNTKKMIWKTSDAMYGYVPPTEDVVNEFYGRLPGNTSGTVGDVDLVTNATSTSTGLMNGIKEALAVADALIKADMPTDEAQIKELAKELVGKDVDLADVTPDDSVLLKKMYKLGGGNGYIAYVVVISANYGTVETETLIHISNTGKIVNTKKMIWKTSDAMYGYVPPTEDVVNEFYGRLPGNTSGTVDGVELVTNATNTSTNLMNGIKEALAAADALIKADMPTDELTVKQTATTLVGKDVEFTDVTPANSSLVKRMYKLSGGNGYIAYVVVISANYGTVETETLIHIDDDGKIVNTKKMIWKTSDAMYGYVPPTEDVVNEFYGRLPGNTSGTVDGVELVTNATNTSTNLMNGIKEALAIADSLVEEKVDNTARIVGIAVIVIALAGAVTVTVIKRKRRVVK